MEFLQPLTWAEALQLKAAHPHAVPIAGGTDVMVEINFDRYRPEYLLDLTRVGELAEWAPDNGQHPARRRGHLHADHRPSWATGCPGWRWPRARSGRRRSATGARSAATSAPRPRPATRTRRCWPRRRRGRGRVGARHPAASRSTSSTPASKRNALAPDELIKAVLITAGRRARSSSAKIGTRNAMVIAVGRVRPGAAPGPARRVGTGIGSAGADPAPRAGRRGVPGRGAGRGRAVGVARDRCPTPSAAGSPSWSRRRPRPIDDVRGTRRVPAARAVA